MFSFRLNVELVKAAPKVNRDQRHCHLREGSTPLRSKRLNQPACLCKQFIPSLSEAGRVKGKLERELVASEALPSYKEFP